MRPRAAANPLEHATCRWIFTERREIILLMKVSGIGRVIFWGGGNLWIGLAVDAIELHAHHAIQIAIGFDGPVQVRPNSGAEWTQYHRGPLYAPAHCTSSVRPVSASSTSVRAGDAAWTRIAGAPRRGAHDST